RPARDLCSSERLSGVGGVALEREALDLDPEQLEPRDVALLGPEALDALQLAQRRQVLLGKGQSLAGDQDIGEGLLDLKDELAPEIGKLEAGDLGRRLRALDAALALAAQLDGLAHVEGVLGLGHTAPAE